jgi:hypothetical protein
MVSTIGASRLIEGEKHIKSASMCVAHKDTAQQVRTQHRLTRVCERACVAAMGQYVRCDLDDIL